MNRKKHYIIQFCFILIGLVVVLLQSLTQCIKLKPLKGFVKEEEIVDLSFLTYYDGSFQKYFTEHAKRITGFHEFFIRSYNQMAYSCFNKITNDNIVKGLDQELYLKMYLSDITGKTLEEKYFTIENAKKEAQKNVDETMRLIDTLHQHGTDFLFVFAPSKALVYPEKMPKYYQNNISDFNLEEYYIELFKEKDIPHIDFLNYFRDIKDTISYPLYSRMASHWAESSIYFVADSILKKLESFTGYNLPSIHVVDRNITSDYTDYDGELESSMNLLFPLKRPAMPRPILELTDTIGCDRPNILITGDSYFDQLMFSCFKEAFNHWDFWQYNQNVYSFRGYYREPFATILDTSKTLKDANIVLAIFTAPMIYQYMFGFPQKAFNMYEIKDTEILEKMEVIRRNKDWYDAVIEQAEQRGLAVEDNLRINAIYVLESERDKH